MLTDDFDLYYNFKFVECIIFVEYSHAEYGECFIGIDNLKQLELFISDNRFMFDNARVNNIFKVLQNIAYIDDEYTTERFTVINNIKNLLNTPYDKQEHYDFYRTEIVQRYNNKKYFKLKDDIVESNKDLINASIALDMSIIESHMFNEEMYNKYFNDLIDNPIYPMSVRAIINEFPLILNNDTFVARVNNILSKNKDNKTNKKLIKEINKRIKR